MPNIKVDLDYSGIEEKELMKYKKQVAEIHKELHSNPNSMDDFKGWMELPMNYDQVEFARIKKAAKRIQKNSDVLVVIGIGGSYLGARAVIEALTSTFYNMLPREQRKHPQILFAGNNMSPNYLNDLVQLIGTRDLSINVISKSGTTTEPAIAFRFFREFMESKYGIDEARKRIYITTDKEKGALKKLAVEEEYETFVIPDNIGGRFSVLTAVGLLPIATAGINIDKLMLGARTAETSYLDPNLKYNECYMYAVARNILHGKGKTNELLVNYEPKMLYFAEWWKQLFGESEGKDGKGIFPCSATFTTDLHSLGQFIQQGNNILFETILSIEEPKYDIKLKKDADNIDELNYLDGKTMDFVNKKAMEGTVEAHIFGGTPNIIIRLKKLNEEVLGELIYFFELSCAVSARILKVNPFNQPGVETYKKNMFKLLGKPE